MGRRVEFSSAVRREALARAAGVCECHRLVNVPGIVPGGCGQPLGPGNTFFEHIVQDFMRADASIENCAVLTKTCWKIKTQAVDLPVIAKVKRQRERDAGIRPQPRRRIPGSRNTPWKKPFYGNAERRPQ